MCPLQESEEAHEESQLMNPGRYDTTGNPEAQFQPGSNNSVLKNKLDVANSAEMDDIELDFSVWDEQKDRCFSQVRF